MTLIAAGKISDKEGFVVSDIRLTDGNIQSDSALKFTRIKNDEKELYIYIAGMISLLEEIEKEFSSGYLDLINKVASIPFMTGISISINIISILLLLSNFSFISFPS